MNIEDLEHIIKILKQNDVTQFELEQDGTRISLTRNSANEFTVQGVNAHLRPAVQGEVQAVGYQQVVSESRIEAAEISKHVKVVSPIVGTFYRRPSPDADLFVKEGDTVKKGDTLCIIEAMKLMNEIEAESSGKIVNILGSDGQVVEYGEVLFLIDPAV